MGRAFQVVEHELGGEVVGVTRTGLTTAFSLSTTIDESLSITSVEARETAATAASLLIQATRLLGEMSQIEDAAWNPEDALRKALELRMRLFGERDVRTAEAMTELSKNGVEDDEEYDLLIKGLELRKELLPANDPLIAESLKFVGRFLDENCDEVKAALPFYEQALSIYEMNDPHSCSTIDCISAVNDVGCAFEQLNRCGPH